MTHSEAAELAERIQANRVELIETLGHLAAKTDVKSRLLHAAYSAKNRVAHAFGSSDTAAELTSAGEAERVRRPNLSKVVAVAVVVTCVVMLINRSRRNKP